MTAQNSTENLPAVRMEASDLRSITTLQDAVDLFRSSTGQEVADAAHEIGDGFTLLDDKGKLENLGFFAVQWIFAPGDYGKDSEFVAVRLVTENGDKFIITDGGTGVCAQLREFTDANGGRNGGLLVERGLRKSEYDKELEDGDVTHAVTWYLNV